MLLPKFAESARIANVSRSRPMIVKLKFDCANRDRFLYLYMRTTWFFGGKASPKPAIANADERASSVTSLVNAPLRQTYPRQLSRVIEDLEEHIKRTEDHKSKFDARLDDAESQRAVFTSQIGTLAEINSVKELAKQNREMGELQARLKIAEKHIEKLQHQHNGKHP